MLRLERESSDLATVEKDSSELAAMVSKSTTSKGARLFGIARATCASVGLNIFLRRSKRLSLKGYPIIRSFK